MQLLITYQANDNEDVAACRGGALSCDARTSVGGRGQGAA